MLLLLLISCQETTEKTTVQPTVEEPTTEEPSLAEPTIEEPDTGIEDTAPSHSDPWPEDEISWENLLSIVYDGEVVTPGAPLSFTSAPAGIDNTTTIRFTITNRSTQEFTINPDPAAWLVADGFAFGETLPSTLAPDESTVIELHFNPVFAREASTVTENLTIPIEAIECAIVIDGSIPRPLRMVLVGDNGYTLVSDSYGEDFFYEYIPQQDIEQTMLASTWGNGVFLRGSRFGGWSSDGFYEYSEDGITWNESVVSGSNFPFSCAYGLGEFLCVRGHGAYLSHSTDGSLFLHEITYAGISSFITDILFNGEHFVGVGREGYRVIATGIESFDSASVLFDEDIGNLNDLDQGDGLIVAVGGTDQYAISTSADGGYSWTDQTFNQAPYARLATVAFTNGIWVTQGYSNTDPQMYRSFDGYTWDPITMTTRYSILGTHNGWFIGSTDTGIYRSQDGENWTEVHILPDEMSVVSMSTEKWEE